jgi:hypothetical protein
MRILLDNGIYSHSEFAESATALSPLGGEVIHGIRRKAPQADTEFQGRINTLPTIGRLIRERIIEGLDSKEIWCERMRYRPLFPFGNALQDCVIGRCNPAIDRSKFAQTVDITDYFAKGGKKDRKADVALGQANQIAFFKLLCSLTSASVDALVSHASQLHLTAFEVESLQDIGWFQFLCERSGSPENYPDVFHLWTAERNGLDALLTLDNDLPEQVSRVGNEKAKRFEIKTLVLQPDQLLAELGIKDLDPVALESDRFYYLHDLC